ncbi:SPOR domain-containing protein [Acidithiobacillus ferrianus]|nr:SPOR domain-containing protein [Acidithiobacillus ferrianus]
MTPNEIDRWQKQQKRLNRVMAIAFILLIVVAAEMYWEHSERHKTGTLRALHSSGANAFLSLPQPTVAHSSAPASMPTVSTVSPPVEVAALPPRNQPMAAPAMVVTAPRSTRVPAQKSLLPPPIPKMPAASTTPTLGTPCSDAGWYVQLGAFGRTGMAAALATQVHGKGFSACIGTLPQNPLYRVLVGPVPNRSAASTVTRRIANLTKHRGYPQFWAPSR